jgi:Tol biopolymer transport system component
MRNRKWTIIQPLLFNLTVLGCWLSPLAGQQAPAAGSPPRPEQAQEEPVLFAENIISTSFDERGIAFAPDGKSLYLTKGVRYADLSVIITSHFAHGTWHTPEVAAFSGRYRDKDPGLSADGTKLYFSSDRPVRGTQPKDFDIWVVEKTARGWGRPKNLGAPVNTDADEQSPAPAAGGTLYFTSNHQAGRGDLDIYRAKLTGQQFAPPENLGEAINSARAEMEVCVDPQERFLVFASARPGFGSADLFVSYFADGQWTPAKNLGAGINTGAEERSPSLSADGQALFFSSNRGMGQAGVQPQRMTYQELVEKLRSARNDSADIYRVSVGRILARH